MANEIKLYPFGFAFSDYILSEIPDHYKKIIVLSKYHYYYDRNAPRRVYETEQKFIIFHGDFVHVGINEQMTQDILLSKLLQWYYENYEFFLDCRL